MRSRHRIAGGAHTRQDHARRVAHLARVAGESRSSTPRRSKRVAQRGDVGAAAVDDGHGFHANLERALGARQLRALDPHRLAQRAAYALEAGLDHVMRVLAATLMWIAAPRLSRQRAEEVRHQLGRQAADGLARNCLRRRRRGGPRGRARPAPGPRPWAAGTRSARCRAWRRAPRAGPGPARAHSPRRCGARRSADRRAPELEREAAVLAELLEHVIEEADARCDGHRRGAIEIDRDLDRRFRASGGRPGRAGASPAAARSRPRFPRRCPGGGRAARDPEVRSELQVRVAIADHALPAIDRCSARKFRSSPIRGLRQSQPSAAWCGQKNSASKRIPWDSSSARRNPAARGSRPPGTTACRAHPGC